MWVLCARRYSQARKGRPCHRYLPIASQALRKTCSVRSSASGWLRARKYRYLYSRWTKRSYSSANALGSRETTTRLTSATTVGSSGPSVSWDGSVPGTDNVFESLGVMACNGLKSPYEPSLTDAAYPAARGAGKGSGKGGPVFSLLEGLQEGHDLGGFVVGQADVGHGRAWLQGGRVEDPFFEIVGAVDGHRAPGDLGAAGDTLPVRADPAGGARDARDGVAGDPWVGCRAP